MPRFSDVQTTSEIKNLTIEYNGLELKFEVDPNQFTLGWQDRISKANTSAELSDEFFKLVKGWDITDDMDEPLPLDVTSVELMTLSTFVSLSKLIATELLPNAKTRS